MSHDGFRPGHIQHRSQCGGGRGRVERDHYPARADDGDQGAGIFDRVRQPDGHAGPGRQVGAVQAPFPGAGGMLQIGEGQLTRSPGSLEVGDAAPVGRRRIDPLLNQRHAPFWW